MSFIYVLLYYTLIENGLFYNEESAVDNNILYKCLDESVQQI